MEKIKIITNQNEKMSKISKKKKLKNSEFAIGSSRPPY